MSHQGVWTLEGFKLFALLIILKRRRLMAAAKTLTDFAALFGASSSYCLTPWWWRTLTLQQVDHLHFSPVKLPFPPQCLLTNGRIRKKCRLNAHKKLVLRLTFEVEEVIILLLCSATSGKWRLVTLPNRWKISSERDCWERERKWGWASCGGWS